MPDAAICLSSIANCAECGVSGIANWLLALWYGRVGFRVSGFGFRVSVGCRQLVQRRELSGCGFRKHRFALVYSASAGAVCREMPVQHRELCGLRVSTIRICTDLFWGLYGFVRVDSRGATAGLKGGHAVDGTFPGGRMPRAGMKFQIMEFQSIKIQVSTSWFGVEGLAFGVQGIVSMLESNQ